MDTEIKAEMEVNVSEEANSKAISVLKLLKHFYEEVNPAVDLLEEESEKFDY